MKRLTLTLLVALLAIVLIVPVAGAAEKKKKKKKKKPASPSGAGGLSVDVAMDLGLPIVGFIPYGSFTNPEVDDADGSFSGSGFIGFPYIGLHAKLYPSKSWFIQIGALTYLRQPGEGTYSFDNDAIDDADFDYVMSRFALLDFGLGAVFSLNPKIRPYAGAGLGIHYVSFSDEEEDESASGWAIGPYGQVGVDFDVTKLKGLGMLFFGGALRMDLIWNWKPYEMEDTSTEISMLYVPISFFISGGIRV